jgi:hypothetical protein
MRIQAIGLAFLVAACGGDTSNGSFPGTGTGTLFVSAQVSAENRVDNALDANGFDTKLEVEVKRAGQVVTDARVVVTSASGERTLVLEGGKYKGGHVGYDRYYRLNVTAGADRVTGATIAGPALHRITNPLPGSSVPPQRDLRISWTLDDAADTASVETKEFKVDATQDLGQILVPGSYFPGKTGESTDDRVKIVRMTRVGLAGGTAGSAIEARVRNEVRTFFVAPLP